jgi:hypothetical protein
LQQNSMASQNAGAGFQARGLRPLMRILPPNRRSLLPSCAQNWETSSQSFWRWPGTWGLLRSPAKTMRQRKRAQRSYAPQEATDTTHQAYAEAIEQKTRRQLRGGVSPAAGARKVPKHGRGNSKHSAAHPGKRTSSIDQNNLRALRSLASRNLRPGIILILRVRLACASS